MFFPSKASLLAAALTAAAYAPTSRGETATVTVSSSIVLDAKSGEGSSIDLSYPRSRSYTSPVEFLQNNSPELILATSFPTPELHAAFETWKSQFERTYDSIRENALRKLIWLENHARIEEHNNNDSDNDDNDDNSGGGRRRSYTLGHNDFSDMTNDEFRKRFYLGEYSPGVYKPRGRSDGSLSSSRATSRKLLRGEEEEEEEEEDDADADEETDEDEATVTNVPEFKNWTDDGAVTKVKNQWFCGACWAFSAVGAIEGAHYIKTGNLTELSIQQLIDCDMTDLGCGGGLMDQAFQYDEDSVGLCALDDYPFAYHRHWFYGCRRYMPYCEPLPDTKVKKFVDVDKTEEALRAAIATQPVSVAVKAGPYDWQFYKDGILDVGCEDANKIDHGVLAVGYGRYDPKTDPRYAKKSDDGGLVAGDYFLVKNSWGESWGVNGYIRVARGTGNEAEGGSSCILTLASRPIMKVED